MAIMKEKTIEINYMIKEKINKIWWLIVNTGYGWDWIKNEYIVLNLSDWEVLSLKVKMYFFFACAYLPCETWICGIWVTEQADCLFWVSNTPKWSGRNEEKKNISKIEVIHCHCW